MESGADEIAPGILDQSRRWILTVCAAGARAEIVEHRVGIALLRRRKFERHTAAVTSIGGGAKEVSLRVRQQSAVCSIAIRAVCLRAESVDHRFLSLRLSRNEGKPEDNADCASGRSVERCGAVVKRTALRSLIGKSGIRIPVVHAR